ncbi:glycoside hydrolase family 16 protein [Xylariaceae sp. FL0804]|nr:glycoside hydrolase family 16 protein [Xylariaceae sp. FL0804]
MLCRSVLPPALALLVANAAAQLTSTCNPLNETCPADPALGTAHTFYFNATPTEGTWNTTAGTVDYDTDTGAAFTINKRGESPTLISNFYFFWGRSEVWLKAASGQGIISSIVWSSDDLDEVDWEFIGGNSTSASTNYYGKGRQINTNADYFNVDGGVQDDYHNYTCVWTADQLEWWIDGAQVRTLLPADANNTDNYPQTPMKMSLGIWAGGDPSLPQGTIEWAGGETNYDNGPYTMYVKSARVEDYSTGKEYTYGDMSGSSDSIKITSGNSTAAKAINKKPEESLSEKWDDLSSSTKDGIFAAAAGVGALAFGALAFYYFKQRRSGQKEAALAAQRDQQERVELERFRKEGRDPDSLGYEGMDYAGAKGTMFGSSYSAVPDSPPHSAVGAPEKEWDPITGGSRSPMPLYQDNVSGPGAASSGPGLSPQATSPVNRGVGSPGPHSNGFPSPGATSPPGRGPGSPANGGFGYSNHL